jgi:glycosyltransferase involved in cell wall biosynthesis
VLLEKQGASLDPFAQAALEFEAQQRSYFKHVRDQIIYFSRPQQAFSYPAQSAEATLFLEDVKKLESGSCLFMEPYDLPWSELCLEIENKHYILCFSSEAQLYQCLQFPPLRKLLCSKQHLILLPQLYPSEQLRKQPGAFRQTPIATHPKSAFQRAVAELQAAERSSLRHDTLLADRCYQLGKKIHYDQKAKQLGSSRFFSLHACRHNIDWSDTHKGQDPSLSSLHQEEWDQKLEIALRAHARPQPRSLAPSESPFRLAHIVPQVVEGGHSPTKLLRLFMEKHDRSKFQPHLFVTERLVLRSNEYPVNGYTSPPSIQRGTKTLASIQELAVPIYVEDASLSVIQTAERISHQLDSLAIDIAVFHGPDAINLLVARQCSCPLKVFFEHGTLPSHPGFDLIIASTDDAARQFADRYQAMGSKIVAHPFVLDLRHNWDEYPPRKSDLGVPEHARILTTISNHLEARLGTEMLESISAILKRHPEAWYLPMGPVKNPDKLLRAFETHGVADRVRFLGTQQRPGQLARAMDLYLNEFPFGSCISMLEAMAAGCPPITMYDPNGPVQARYGGDYFGIDHAVTSLNASDYVDLACKILEDEVLYKEWSRRALSLYEKRANPTQYVGEIEAEILQSLAHRAGGLRL